MPPAKTLRRAFSARFATNLLVRPGVLKRRENTGRCHPVNGSFKAGCARLTAGPALLPPRPPGRIRSEFTPTDLGLSVPVMKHSNRQRRPVPTRLRHLFLLLLLPLLSLLATSSARARSPIRLAEDPALSPDGQTLAFAWRGD